jgi:membrane protein YqaA with SNARE-associated domain
MVDWKIGRFHVKNLEVFTIVMLTTIYTLALTIEPGSWLYDSIANLSASWHSMATESDSALWMAFLFSTFGNTSILIVFPYILIVFDIGKVYPNWVLLGIVSGIGAAIGEISSYIVGRIIGNSKKMSDSEIGEKFHKIREKFEKKPGLIPITIFLFALTPLPDDAILVPFGMMKYPYWKSIPPCMLGKTLLCMFMAWLGHLVAENANVLNDIIEYYPYMSFLRIIVPSETVNPSGDLIQFSLVFIIIYIMVRLDFDKWSMKHSNERKDFETILLEGGNHDRDELIELFQIKNTKKFDDFLERFSEKHTNIKIKKSLVHFDAIIDKKQAFDQSMKFAAYINAIPTSTKDIDKDTSKSIEKDHARSIEEDSPKNIEKETIQ